MDKNAFIVAMLNDPSLQMKDRERIVRLLTRDFNDSLEGNIRKIVREEMTNANVASSDASTPEKQPIPTHSPCDMVKFYYRLSKDEGLKWYTHDPDGVMRDYSIYMKSSDTNLREAYKDLSLNRETRDNVRNFVLTSKYPPKDWNGSAIAHSWRDIGAWLKDNPGGNPFTATFDNEPFKSYVDKFKNSIEFRTNLNSAMVFNQRVMDFIYNIQEIPSEIREEVNFTNRFLYLGKDFNEYVDIRQLFAAIKIIFKWIAEKKELSSSVEIDLDSAPEFYELSIKHIDSRLKINRAKMKAQSGDMKKLRDTLFCVADCFISADWEHDGVLSSVKIDLLNGDMSGEYRYDAKPIELVLDDAVVSELDSPVGGVKYSIRLYKNQ